MLLVDVPSLVWIILGVYPRDLLIPRFGPFFGGGLELGLEVFFRGPGVLGLPPLPLGRPREESFLAIFFAPFIMIKKVSAFRCASRSFISCPLSAKA